MCGMLQCLILTVCQGLQVTWAGGPIRGQALAEYTTHPAPGYTSSNFCVLPQMRGFWGLYRGGSDKHIPRRPHEDVYIWKSKVEFH